MDTVVIKTAVAAACRGFIALIGLPNRVLYRWGRGAVVSWADTGITDAVNNPTMAQIVVRIWTSNAGSCDHCTLALQRLNLLRALAV
jgi:hypothetical protein